MQKLVTAPRIFLFPFLILSFVFSVSWMSVLSAAEGPLMRRLSWVASPSSTDVDRPTIAITLHDESTGLAASVSPALAARLEEAFPASASKLIQRREGEWVFSITGEAGGEALSETFSSDFLRCIKSLSLREREAVKYAIYNLDENLDLGGNLQVPPPTRAAIERMRDNYRRDRCQETGEDLPRLTVELVKRASLKLLSGNDPSLTIDTEAQMIFERVFSELIYGAEGIWTRAAEKALDTYVREGLARLARGDQLQWLDRPYAGFVDFVLTSHQENRLTRPDFLVLAAACGIDGPLKLFRSFEAKSCADSVQLVTLSLPGAEPGLVVLGEKEDLR